jgi:hypothetical protein
MRFHVGLRSGTALFLFALVVIPSRGAETAAVRVKESEARLKKDITFLASDECEGRGPTTEGLNRAADYIADQFKKAGLKPGNDGSYFQSFPLDAIVPDGPARLTLTGPGDKKLDLKAGTDFNAMGLSKSASVSGPLVFATFGAVNWLRVYDDYRDVDVKGKVVVVLSDMPGGNVRFAGDTARGIWLEAMLRSKANQAARRGAVGMLFVHTKDVARDGDTLFDFAFTALSARPPFELPVFQVKRSILQTMLADNGADLAKIEDAVAADGKPHGVDLKGWSASLEVKTKRDRIMLKNVIGVLEGAGPFADETVVIGAHYDHLGYGGAGGSLVRLKKPAIHHGADDNASGSTTVMELARRFAAVPKRGGRRLVFMTFSGEELGLNGSVYYCQKPLFPLSKTIAMVNLDMVGRGTPDKATGKERVQVHGLDTAKEFDKLFDEVSKNHDHLLIKKTATRGNVYFMASDQFSFFQKNVPVVFFFTGDHPDYHRPSDTSDKINLQGMREVADLTEDLIARFATEKERFTFVRPTGSAGGTRGVRLGIGLTGDDKDGVIIESLEAGMPAEKAGMKVGDRIFEAAGKPVKNQQGLVTLLRGLRPGDTLDVGIERSGKKHSIKVEFPFVARLGIRPDYQADKEGVSVVEVSEGGPAAKGGIKKDDRIVELGGKKVKDLESYMELLQGRKRGETLEVGVIRDGKKQTIKLVLE